MDPSDHAPGEAPAAGSPAAGSPRGSAVQQDAYGGAALQQAAPAPVATSRPPSARPSHQAIPDPNTPRTPGSRPASATPRPSNRVAPEPAPRESDVRTPAAPLHSPGRSPSPLQQHSPPETVLYKGEDSDLKGVLASSNGDNGSGTLGSEPESVPFALLEVDPHKGEKGQQKGEKGQQQAGESAEKMAEAQVLDTTGASGYVPQRGGKVWNRDDWLPMEGESWRSYMRRLIFEGHTVLDALMTCACAQIGQIMLNSPSALYRAGFITGCIMMFLFLLSGLWTIYVALALYLDYKKDKIKDGSWWDTDGKHMKVSQYMEVVGHHLGRWAYIVSICIAILALFGVLLTQITACSNDMYYIDASRTKREWSLIFGGVMVFTMILVPRFTKFRLLNIIGLVGTGMTAIYIWVDCISRGWDFDNVNWWPKDMPLSPTVVMTKYQNWFTGTVVLLGELGSHAVVYETMEAMEQPKHYDKAFWGAWSWTIIVVVPHTILVNLSYGAVLAKGVDNVYAVLPMSQQKQASAILMIIHQYVAFGLYGTSLAIVWEKLCRVHTKPYWVRLLVRIPLGAFIWFLSILAPFYGPLNALYSSLAVPFLGFVLPMIAIMWRYRTPAGREHAVLKPWRIFQWGNWALWWFVNVFHVLFFSGFAGTCIYYSALTVKQYYKTFGAFAECYLCPVPAAPAVSPPAVANTTFPSPSPSPPVP